MRSVWPYLSCYFAVIGIVGGTYRAFGSHDLLPALFLATLAVTAFSLLYPPQEG